MNDEKRHKTPRNNNIYIANRRCWNIGGDQFMGYFSYLRWHLWNIFLYTISHSRTRRYLLYTNGLSIWVLSVNKETSAYMVCVFVHGDPSVRNGFGKTSNLRSVSCRSFFSSYRASYLALEGFSELIQ